MKIKGFDKDLKCRGFQFEIGKEYKIETNKEPELCTDTVFHYCESLQQVHKHYSVLPEENNRFCEIETMNNEVSDGQKCGCSHIRIIREIAGAELNNLRMLNNGNTGLFNTGKNNSGDCNSGNRNSGNRNSGNSNSGSRNSGNINSGLFNSGIFNSGDSNSGDSNSGNWNSGNWNSGNWNVSSHETGFFNTRDVEIINVFNKQCNVKIWTKCIKPSFIYFNIIRWVDFSSMTSDEKTNNPNAENCGGYLKQMDYKEAFQKSYNDLSEEERINQTALLKALPNFDADVFYEISGIRIK